MRLDPGKKKSTHPVIIPSACSLAVVQFAALLYLCHRIQGAPGDALGFVRLSLLFLGQLRVWYELFHQ